VASTINSYVLRVTDLDEAMRFWQDAMGAELMSRTQTDTASEAVLASPIGGGSVVLTRPLDDDRPVDLGHSIFRQYVITSDSARLYQHATSLGYEATHEPFDVPERVNVVKSYTRQPDGYLMDLCEYQGPLRHGMIDPKQRVQRDQLASYIGQVAIYVTALDPALEFWDGLDVTLLDRVAYDDYMELALLRGDGGTLLQLMQINGGRERSPRTAAVMPQPGEVDLGSGIQGFRVEADDCRQLHEQVVAKGFRSLGSTSDGGSATTATVLDPDGYVVEIRQRDS
jgi:catechol 2,3-dioxygenase-like lactoylglutathione lyase family enzyme